MDTGKALLSVKKKCMELGFDQTKVDSLYRQMISGKLYFAYFPNKDTDGLTNDMGTQAVPLFVVDSTYCVKELEAAAAFFGGAE